MDIRQRFIEVLEQNIEKWEDAAANCESLGMGDRGEMYREQARQLKTILADVKASK